MNKIILILLFPVYFFGCSKMEEKKSTDNSKTPVQQTPKSTTADNNSQNENKSGQKDEKAIELSKEADEALAKYSSDKSAAAKDDVVKKCLAAANYIEFDSDLPPKEKYRPALKYYRKVLEIDPKNEDAMKNRNEIEGIYKQMGMPIPE